MQVIMAVPDVFLLDAEVVGEVLGVKKKFIVSGLHH